MAVKFHFLHFDIVALKIWVLFIVFRSGN